MLSSPKQLLVPDHVAIIMDGNRRWAAARGMPVFEGHRQGREATKRAISAAQELGVRYLTLYAFSSENSNRPPQEVSFLQNFFLESLREAIGDLHQQSIRLKVIGDLSLWPEKWVEEIRAGERLTQNNTGLVLTFALDYGSRQEITRAVKNIALDVENGKLKPLEIQMDLIKTYLYTHNLPDPALLIRTSGEKRISNFLLWQLAYTELYFLDKLWPDFDKHDFEAAITDFRKRERRFGT